MACMMYYNVMHDILWGMLYSDIQSEKANKSEGMYTLKFTADLWYIMMYDILWCIMYYDAYILSCLREFMFIQYKTNKCVFNSRQPDNG